MKQIALGAFTASQCAVVHGDMGGVEGWRGGGGGGGGIQGWLDSLQSAVRKRQAFNQLVRRRQNGTSRAPARHKAGLRHRSQMLSPILW